MAVDYEKEGRIAIFTINRPEAFNMVNLQVFQELVVVGVRADPKPSDGVAVEHADGAVADADTGGVDGRIGVHALEVQARMGRVLAK